MLSKPIFLQSVLRLLRIGERTDLFEQWFLETYGRTPEKNVLHGYKYFLECCFHILFDVVGEGQVAGLKNDLLLNRAYMEWVSLEKLDNTCEKTILLKNIYKYVKNVNRAADYGNLKKSVADFNQFVSTPLEHVLEENLTLKKDYRQEQDNLASFSVITTLYLYFNQITGSTPMANVSFLAGTIPRNRKKTDNALQGYAYALQFVWQTILGPKKYLKTSLINLHNCDSWKDYVYLKSDQDKDDGLSMFDNKYDPAAQTCLDSHFEYIKKQIIRPLEKKFKVQITRFDELWNFKTTRGKRHLKDLLNSSNLKMSFDSLSTKDRIETLLYWLPIEVVDYSRSSSFNGIPAFNTMLAGTVGLLKKSSPFKKCIVCKFKHPRGENRNDYSYAILVDSLSASDHYTSGWIIYYDCTNDYSGFARSEHATAESLIRRFQRMGKLELRTLEIEYDAFTKFVASYLHRDDNDSTDHKETIDRLHSISKNNKQLWKDMQGTMLEWIAYYVHSQRLLEKKVKWNIEKKTGEIDVLVEYPDRILLVECKLKSGNTTLQAECDKLKKKAIRKAREFERHVDMEFWFWYQPSEQDQKTLSENETKFVVVSDINKSEFKDLNLAKIRELMEREFME